MSSAEILDKSASEVAAAPLRSPAAVKLTTLATHAGDAIVRLECISRAFGSVVALNEVSLEVQRGEIFGIIGRSGAGKSTLIRAINGLERIDAGRIIVDGNDLSTVDESGLNRIRHKVGMIFQHFNLLSMKTVFENVELPLKLAGLARDQRSDAVWELLDLVGLRDKADVYPAKLSGGQKQRVGIARALAGKPALLLSDEATSALDPETTLSILRLLKDLQGKLGVTIVLITHEMSVIREICDRVAVLEQGQIAELGPVWEIFGHPRADVTRRLLRTVRPPLPESLERSMRQDPVVGGRTLLRVGGSESDHYAAVLAMLAADSSWHPQIVHAEVDRVGGHPVGSVTFSVRYHETALRDLLAAAERKSIEIKVLGHVGG
jgi:D-methionine transport system ATP-binding protein